MKNLIIKYIYLMEGNGCKLIIRDLEPFMSEEYFNNELLSDTKNKSITKEISSFKVLLENNSPKFAIFMFKNKEAKEKFQSLYQNYPKLTRKIIYDENITEQELRVINRDDSERILFGINYEMLINTIYERKIKESEGLIFTDKVYMQKQDKVISFVLKKMGSNLIKGKSIMNVSLPIDIFDKRSLLQLYAYEMSFAPYYLERAALSKEPLEKLRLSSAFLISQLYLSPLQSKPFNPILGETFQCVIGPDTNIYIEHTVHSPPTSNFLVKGKNYTAYGYIITEASIGPNSVKARKSGNFLIRFNDGTIHKLHFPTICIKGTTVGTRTFNFCYNALVSDETNRMVAYFKFNPDKKGTLGKLFSSSQKTFCDTFKGQICNLDDVEIDLKKGKHNLKKNAKVIESISGEWTGWLEINKTRYWEKGEFLPATMYQMNYILPSDSKNRSDLSEYIKNNDKLAQENKDKLEDIQRSDRKLRENKK